MVDAGFFACAIKVDGPRRQKRFLRKEGTFL